MLALRREIIEHETEYYSDNFNTSSIPTPDLVDKSSLTKLLYLAQRVIIFEHKHFIINY